jgi:hypothetical protein
MMQFKLNSPPPHEVKGPKGEVVHVMVITLQDTPAGELFTIQYFSADGKLLRQDKECNVREGVVSEGVAQV